MKKIAFLMALIYLLIGLSACMPEQPESAKQTEPNSTLDTSGNTPTTPHSSNPNSEDLPGDVPPAVLSEIPLSSLSSPIVQRAFYADDGKLVLSYTYQNIFPIHQDVAVADNVNIAMYNDLERATDLQQILQQAMEQYTNSPQGWVAYECKVLFGTTRLDQNVLSILGEVTHTTTETSSIPMSATYSLVNGKKLSFKDIQSSKYNYYPLANLIDAAVKRTVSEDQLLPKYDAIIKEQLLSTDCSNWYFSENGLCFYYSPYEIAAKAAGTIIVEIPYSDLDGILNEDYFPASAYTTGGSLHARLFKSDDFFAYQNFTEIIQDADGSEILLFTDGTIADIRFELGSWNEEGTVFTPSATIFACDGIWQNSAILLQIQIPDTTPNLRITYTSNGTTYTKFLSQSGKDSSIILSNY